MDHFNKYLYSVFSEELIRRRLLFDGDGNGDEKRITTILRTIIKWTDSECDDEERFVVVDII